MQPIEKPRRNPGTFCPLWRKDVSKVCHTCDWWESILVRKGDDPPYDYWSCAINRMNVIMKDVGAGVDGLQKAEESFRNTAWNETQNNLHDIVETVKHQTKFNTDILHRVGNGLAAVASAANTKLIGNTQHDVGD